MNRSLGYVLTHLWLWPLRLWPRPFDLADDVWASGRTGSELVCALLGAGLWGAILDLLGWWWSGNPQLIWYFSLVLAGAVAGAYVLAETAAYFHVNLLTVPLLAPILILFGWNSSLVFARPLRTTYWLYGKILFLLMVLLVIVSPACFWLFGSSVHDLIHVGVVGQLGDGLQGFLFGRLRGLLLNLSQVLTA